MGWHDGWTVVPDWPSRKDDDPFLTLGLDSHRYRCCGNGVVTPLAEWIGLRLAAYFDDAVRP